jgi:phosphatidylserine decarboxylase
MPAKEIVLYNRQSGGLESEEVVQRRLMALLYATPWGRWVTDLLLSRRLFSQLYGRQFHRPNSRKQIAPFVRHFNIDMGEVMVPDAGFQSFNDFFIRQLQPHARPIDPDPHRLIAPAESRLKVLTLKQETLLDVKGTRLTLGQLLDNPLVARQFTNGVCLQFRLAPSDYHRFGYLDTGEQGPVHSVSGRLYSVSPLALRYRPGIWGQNYRQWCQIKTRTLGTILEIDVGATTVGSIVQHQPHGGPCRRGAEKGYFQLGGSTVLMVLPPGRITIDDDIWRHSQQGIETLVRYRETIGRVNQ